MRKDGKNKQNGGTQRPRDQKHQDKQHAKRNLRDSIHEGENMEIEYKQPSMANKLMNVF